MTWMQRLKRVFVIDIETCRRCGGRLEVLASIEDPVVIERILAHVNQTSPAGEAPFALRTSAGFNKKGRLKVLLRAT
jgi:hypothetical protein